MQKNCIIYKICIKKENGEYLYSITIAGIVVFEIVNTQTQVFDDVKVYTSDNFFAPPCVYMKLFEITTQEGNIPLLSNHKYTRSVGSNH